MLFQVRILAEFLQEATVDHDLADTIPDHIAVILHGAAQGLDLARIVGGEDGVCGLFGFGLGIGAVVAYDRLVAKKQETIYTITGYAQKKGDNDLD